MIKRLCVSDQPKEKKMDYILGHWFLGKVNANTLLRNDISMLWWIGNLTYDTDRKDPYELTREVFAMLDYTRSLLPGTQGRNRNLAHAVLEFVIDNTKLFSSYKEGRVRFIMRKLNFLAGYKSFPALSKEDIKSIISRYSVDIAKVKE